MMFDPASQESIVTKLKGLDPSARLAVMEQMISNIPDDRIQQTFWTFLDAAKTDDEAMGIVIERLAGYWAKYNAGNPQAF